MDQNDTNFELPNKGHDCLLFDMFTRTYDGPAQYRENIYGYLNRSARKEIENVRDRLENWFSELPRNEKKEMKERFKKSFDSVFYELFLFQLFKCLGFTITLHPDIPGSSKKPDFLLKKNNLEIYAEAKITKYQSQSDEANERRVNEFYDTLNKMKSENFYLFIRKLKFKTKNQPQTKGLIKFLEEKLKNLYVNDLYDAMSAGKYSEAPQLKYSDEQLEIVVVPLPANPDARGKINRPVGILPLQTIFDGAEESLENSISTKANRYGKLDKPYLICINAQSVKSASWHEIENTVWGSLAFTWSSNPEERDEKLQRRPDGVFLKGKEVKMTNVSGILVTQVSATDVMQSMYRLYKHPFSENSFDFEQLGLKYCVVENNFIKTVNGDDLGQILMSSKADSSYH